MASTQMAGTTVVFSVWWCYMTLFLFSGWPSLSLMVIIKMKIEMGRQILSFSLCSVATVTLVKAVT